MEPVKGIQAGRADTAVLMSQDPPTDERLVIKWLETQPESRQGLFAQDRFKALLEKASQPRYASGTACIKLCYFIEQCRNSKQPRLRDLAFSEKTSIDLFNFYIEWNEKNQHRSMRQVLELLMTLISFNPDENYVKIVTRAILSRILSILTHQSAQPLVKPALKSMECFLGKGTISTRSLIGCYENQILANRCSPYKCSEENSSWDSFMAEIFGWMVVPDVSPSAGKLLVTLFVKLKDETGKSVIYAADHTVLWQRWIRFGLSKNPEILENLKNYLFPSLFKLDRSGSIQFLGDLHSQGSVFDLRTEDSDAQSLLHLAAIEVGKKLGLVEETSTFQAPKNSRKSSIVFEESTIGELLTHTLDTVRSLAFSVLVSSSSPIRPYSILALTMLQKHISTLHADTDAKFRNEILSSTRRMIERLAGAVANLTRELENVNFLLDLHGSGESSTRTQKKMVLIEIHDCLKLHKRFIQWYLDFLSGELIPTASYQRHITALKAVTLLLRSGMIQHDPSLVTPEASENATALPFQIRIFNSGNMRLLLDLLMDPFEDVRISAGFVLKFARCDDFELGRARFNLIAQNQNGSQAGLSGQEARVPYSLNSIQSSRASRLSLDSHFIGFPQALLDFVNRAADAAKRTGRADYGDGLARTWEILYCLSSSADSRWKVLEYLVAQLELQIEIAEGDLIRAVIEAPIHGNFAALNFVWDAVNFPLLLDKWFDQQVAIQKCDNLNSRMVECCKRVWRVVRDILCNHSPEGHLPSEIDMTDDIDTKGVLSYSFRAIHESSNLMRTLITKMKVTWTDGSPVLPAKVFSDIGDLTFEQLSNLRHRGAFSTVSLTFARCCQFTQYQTSNFNSHQELLVLWYQGALQSISEQVSTTRRSAGIPALITGILSSNARIPSFENIMDDLMRLARTPAKLSNSDETNLPQVHSMNCLKEIFRSSLLNGRAHNYVSEGLQIATDSLSSEIWAIRNCGLLLLRSLIDVLFGTNESKTTIDAGWDGRSVKLSYDNHPALPALLLKLLNADTGVIEDSFAPKYNPAESVFPALDIIRRAGPPATHRNEIFGSVSKHLRSRAWHVREIAARTICTLLFHSDWLSQVVELVESSSNSTNQLHGSLMAIKFVLDRRLELDDERAIDGLDKLALLLKEAKMLRFFERSCPEIFAAYLEVTISIARILLSSRNSQATSSQPNLETTTNHLFLRDASDELLGLMKTYRTLSVHTSLAENAIIRRSVLVSGLREDILGLQNIVSFATTLGEDAVLAAIEVIPEAWVNFKAASTLRGLVKAYVVGIKVSLSPAIRASAIVRLAEVIDQYLGQIEIDESDSSQSDRSDWKVHHPSIDHYEIVRREIGGLEVLLQHGTKTPTLSNAEIRIIGSLLLCQYVSQKHLNQTLDTCRQLIEAWAKLLMIATACTSEFDTRQAAATSIASFYNNTYFKLYIPNDECLLPPLFVLYDTLNDDDDEIRHLSARTVSAMLHKSLVPLAARVELACYISDTHTQSPLFAWNVVCRMTGSRLEKVDNARIRLQPFQIQIGQVLKDDDSLFVQEEQNLFIDEVREAKLWSEIFENIALETRRRERADFEIHDAWSQPYAAIIDWVMDGLLDSCSFLQNDDGPLGWTSKPTVFALLMRLLLSANAIIHRHQRYISSAAGSLFPGNRRIGALIFALEQFATFGKEKKIHESLLLEVQRKSSLPVVNLGAAFRGPSTLRR